MGCRTRSLVRALRGRIRSSRRRTKPRLCNRSQKSFKSAVVNGEQGGVIEKNASVSEKLKALKSLIPAQNGDTSTMIKADRLFEETADYIVFLRNQVEILQRLVEFYGSDEKKKSTDCIVVNGTE